MVSLDLELSKLFQCQCQHQPHKDHNMAQLSHIAPSENWEPRFSSMSQKLKIVFDFFPIMAKFACQLWNYERPSWVLLIMVFPLVLPEGFATIM